jgi:hypothetical protein
MPEPFGPRNRLQSVSEAAAVTKASKTLNQAIVHPGNQSGQEIRRILTDSFCSPVVL